MNILLISLAPIFIIAIYIYARDKYEREPLKLLLFALLAGGLTTIPIIFVEMFLSLEGFFPNAYAQAAYDGFVVAAFTEELFKFAALFLLIWRNPNFNENFDGIVYAVFVSLGFAAVENVLYVATTEASVGFMRAVTAVPAHALFGVSMGFHFALARFRPSQRPLQLFLAVLIPIALHGFYDFCLMTGNDIFLLVFVVFIVFMWILGFKKMKMHSDSSVFRDTTLD